MKTHPLAALVLLLLFVSSASADAGPPPPRFVEGASDTRVYAQNIIVLGLLLAGLPIALGLTVARRTPRWGWRTLSVLLAGCAGVFLTCVGYLGGAFITNDPPRRYGNRPPPVIRATQPAETPGDPVRD